MVSIALVIALLIVGPVFLLLTVEPLPNSDVVSFFSFFAFFVKSPSTIRTPPARAKSLEPHCRGAASVAAPSVECKQH